MDLFCLGTRNRDEVFGHVNIVIKFWLHKIRGISSLSKELLPCQEGLSHIKLKDNNKIVYFSQTLQYFIIYFNL